MKQSALERRFIGTLPGAFGSKCTETLVLHKGIRALVQNNCFNRICHKMALQNTRFRSLDPGSSELESKIQVQTAPPTYKFELLLELSRPFQNTKEDGLQADLGDVQLVVCCHKFQEYANLFTHTHTNALSLC